ncbi:putative flocculation protein FLO11-like [Scophthalmus maximus]|uniref:Putative flocculation protein FLO11-like n=1 Tax=Scophthalmus maximus TaxID=52904 RepID=A0A2U9BRN3_SCOMX|nr:putative flocculation protein FLO11-like [Scophthalmus maximus]
MSCVTSLGAHVFMTTYLLFVMGSVAQKVYFDCGAKVDVVDVQGLILSPGFPYNYSSGTHCVWLFIVPVDYQLILEIFDFDVFESHDAAAQYSAISNFEGEEADEEVTFTPGSFAADETSSAAEDPMPQNVGGVTKPQQSSQDGEVKQVVVQEKSTKMEITKVSNSAKRSADASSGLSLGPPSSLLLLPGALPAGDKVVNSASLSHLRGDLSPSSNPSTAVEETTLASPRTTDTPAVSPETQQSVLDACPHDVLYISDLITFSSRFCGSNRPPSSQLVFGSNQEMVEVIMELITTTHWGRGFALLFHYHNLTEPGGELHASAPTASKVDSLLAAVSGAAFFAMILTSALCIIFRPKLCPKRAGSCSSTSSEVPEGVQNTAAEVSELQLMAENQTNLGTGTELRNNNDDRLPHTVSASVDISQDAAVDLSCSGLTELDLGADEAPSSLTADCRGGDSRKVFSEIHLDAAADSSTVSDSSISNASYPLTQPAQRQRRLNSTSNLRRSRFPGPCFGLLSGAAEPAKASGAPQSQGSPPEPASGSSPSAQCHIESGQAAKRRDFQGEGDHVSVQVFAISEEEDRQPLVPAEHLDQTSVSAVLNGLARGTYEGKPPAAGNTGHSPQYQRARPEWRPWGSQASGGVGPLPSNTTAAMTESNAVGDGHLGRGQPTALGAV